MENKNIKLTIGVCITLVSLLIIFFITIVNNDFRTFSVKKITKFDHNAFWSKDTSSNLKLLKKQISERLWTTSPLYLKQFLDSQDNINKNPNLNEQQLVDFITKNDPSNRLDGKDSLYIDYDTLQKTMEFADIYWNASELFPERKILFRTIASFYTNKIVNTLEYYGGKNNTTKYNHKFKFLSDFCNLYSMPINIEMDSPSKFLMHFSDQRWSHILNAFWGKTSIVFKTIIITLVVISFIAYYLLISASIKKIKSFIKNEKS